MQPAKLTANEVETAAGVLTRAFDDDPGIVFILPEPKARAKLLPGFFRTLTRYGLLQGEVLGLEDPAVAVSIWLPPPRGEGDDAAAAEAGFPTMMELWDAGARERSGILLQYFSAMHARLMPEPHAYLAFLGVEPARQGQGCGGSLLQAKLQPLHAAGTSAYLETLKARNVPFYERHGFRVLEHSAVPGTDIQVWGMRTDAR